MRSYCIKGMAKGHIGKEISVYLYVRREVVNDILQGLFVSGVKAIANAPKERLSYKKIKLLACKNGSDILLLEQFPRWSLSRNPLAPEAFYHQTLTDSVIDLSDGWDTYYKNFLSDSLKKHYRRAEKLGLTLVQGFAENDLSYFYEELLLPTSQHRHASLAMIPTFDEFKKKFPKCRLYFAKNKEGHILGGCLIITSKDSSWRLLRLGLDRSLWEDSRQKAQIPVFLNAEILKIACQEKIKMVSLGVTCALEADGIWQHKMLWGVKPQFLPTYPVCLIEGVTSLGNQFLSDRRPFRLLKNLVYPYS